VANLARLREPASHVIRIFRGVEVCQVAGNAGRQRDVVVVVLVTVRACPRGDCMQPRQREPCSRVIELCIRPRCRIVALLARRGEAHVRHRRGRAVEICLMARNASRHRNVVVVVLVAIRAGPRRHHVQACQRKARRRVIELRIRPRRCVVALFARRGEARMRHRGCRVVEIRLVARNTGRHRDVVIVVDVAVRARPRWHHVQARQREACLRVVERGIRPLHRGVTLFACRREARMRYRRRCTIEVRLMARYAGRHRDLVVVVDMAIRAHPRRIHV